MARVAHLITPLGPARPPRRHVIFDTEAATTTRYGQMEQNWRLGVGCYLDRGRNGDADRRRLIDYFDPADLWADVAAFTRPRSRTIVWAHNLAYDLRISDALRRLPALGFKLQGIVLERTASWASFGSPGGTILCCDLHSWLPAPLGAIAGDVGMVKSDVHHQAVSDADLLRYCRQDVLITAEAVAQLLDTLDTLDLGPFRPTGSGQSMSAWRRRFMEHAPLAHDDDQALDAERRAMWTGRCEAWRWGDHSHAGAVEYDLQAAYCNIAASCDLPLALYGATGPMTFAQYQQARKRYTILAECTIHTGVPAVPAPDGERVHWPVGAFDTTLWDPELDLAYHSALRVDVRRAWLYRPAPLLAQMAQWILDGLAAGHDEITPLRRRLLKHWSRTLVGRQALRYRRWEPFGQAPQHDLELGVLFDLTDGTSTDLLQVGRDLMTLAALAEADSSTPQVTGWVMSEARRRLWRLMMAAGLPNVLYVDTDALIVNRAGARKLDAAIAAGDAYSLVRKTSFERLVIHGPRNLEADTDRRLSGVPTRARQTGPLEFDGEVWRSLKESMTRGELSTVVLTPRTFKITPTDPRRHHLPDGTTQPHHEGTSDA